MTIILWLLLSTCFFAIGEYLSKKFALEPSIKLVCYIVPMYALGTLAWLPAIHKGQMLSTVGTLWTVLSMVMTIFIGLFIFHESLTTIQIVGICFAFVSVILLSL